MSPYLRGELAKEAEINIETLRFYEKNGLLPQPERSAGGYRLYPEETLGRLAFIRNAKSCGFTLREIRKALVKSADGSIGLTDFVAVVERKLAVVDREIARQNHTRSKLEALRSGLLDQNRQPGVQDTLDFLKMKG